MKQHFKKYLRYSCSCSLLFTLLGIGAVQTAVGATCKETQVTSCESVAFVLFPKKDCKKYYEITPGGQLMQCMQKDTSHQCTTGTTKMKCTPPKADSK